tara:strand:- start:271 stop:426 length:156 start_codon:yes stop_codon:yes gene_type:complete
MTWTYEITQQTDTNGNLIPLWIVTQWNTNNTKSKIETVITTAVKEIAYPNE